MTAEHEMNVNESELFQRLQAHTQPLVLDFWASWCMPCRAIEPWMRRLQKEYQGRVEVWKVNADEHARLLRRLRIFGIPTLIAYHQGSEVARQTGVGSFQSMQQLFEAALQGEALAPRGLARSERFLRLLIAGVLFYVAYLNRPGGGMLLLGGLAGIVFFSAVYDRCPVWRALYPRLRRWLAARLNTE